AIMFERVRRGRNAGDCYCKVALADPAGERTRLIARVDEKKKLPYWLKSLNGRMRSKASVRHTRGTDGDSLVIVVDPDDHQRMVALFLAAKAWVLKEGFRLRQQDVSAFETNSGAENRDEDQRYDAPRDDPPVASVQPNGC